MKLHFVTVDVFTDQRFGGNPLAVVLNPEGLNTEQMQQIAGEFNLSETTFVLLPRELEHTAEVRIFTPRAEIPFAGHPNIGTAYVLAQLGEVYGRPIGDTLAFEEKAGLVRVEIQREDGATAGARLTAPREFTRGEEFPAHVVAACCSLNSEDINIRHHAPCIASAGMPFVFAELKSRERLAAAAPQAHVMADHVPRDVAGGIYLYAPAKESEVDYQARMFAPLHGISEDPATGSANVAAIGLLASLRPESDIRLTKTIAQGVDMGRPSLLLTEADKHDGEVTATHISGRCAPMMEGTLDLG